MMYYIDYVGFMRYFESLLFSTRYCDEARIDLGAYEVLLPQIDPFPNSIDPIPPKRDVFLLGK